ncbi:acyl-CoA dehydrogenase family protein [Haloarchaeobius sp. HRN-SO-5]|uniref:acyl-CoA dehydrogenase family protein n=1 Tax=Haloarchaeobius sp. HRN-SO-5 TaxID=3446118 RepID=UPI003EBB668A
MEYHDPEEGRRVAERTRQFVEEEVLPVEREWLGQESVPDSVVADLRDAARDHDVYGPQIPDAYGGLGLGFRSMLPVFEEAGRSLLGPLALRCGAPDEGNMHTLELVGTEEQKERWLAPLAAGEMNSGFCMTEPLQGGGSDPKMLRTSARKEGDEWVIDGHKWWTTGGSDADVFLVMARSDPDAHPYEGTSIVLVPRDTDGVDVVRDVPHLGGEPVGSSHAEIRFDGARVPVENTLGPENAGFAVAQRRLGPARLTHCMRFGGMADRALDVATAYASEREAFGEPLAEKQSLRFRVARARTRLHAARTMVRHAADAIDAGDEARIPVAMAKVFTANVVQEAVDEAVQVCGGNGIGKDLPLADFYENVRSFRIIDGADEVHLRSIARAAFEDPKTDELEGLTRFGE